MTKKTILYDEHVKLGGKMIEYAGYFLPVEYSSISEEHEVIRTSVGMFDVSHMGEILVTGEDASDYLNYMNTNNVKPESKNRMIYGLMLYEDGGVVDDLMMYKYDSKKYLLVVNASNKDKDFKYLNAHKYGFDVEVEDLSDQYSQIALQGPKAIDIMLELSDDVSDMKMFDFKTVKILDAEFIVSRSGYTGSDGFEIYGENEDILKLFNKFVELGVVPCGLGARDTLRFEASMPLYGHEISENITPLEAGLSYAVKFDKKFIGCEALKAQKLDGIKKKLVGLTITGHGIARGGYDVESQGKKIGHITTGYMIPNTSDTYALALIDANYAKIGDKVEVRIRRNLVDAIVRNRQFLNKNYVK